MAMATALSLSHLQLSLFPPPRGTHHHHHLRRRTPPNKRKPPLSISSSGSTRPETDCPVPDDQQPVNEYDNLSSSFPFSWASPSAHPLHLPSRLVATGLSFSLLLGLPVSCFGSSEPEPIRLLLGSVSSGIFATTLVVLRLYLGWAYVGNRLLSATVEYEETGWYDGQIWVKTPEALTRDRLLGSFEVKPILNRLKNILIILAASLMACGLLLVDFETSQNTYKYADVDEGRVVAGVYNDESARSFEPDAFCGEPTQDSE